jgi:rubrerythrin
MLDQVADYHGQLANYYSQLSDDAAQQRVKMLLDYMASHEINLQESLAAYEEDASRQILNTYVDCKQCDDVLMTCQQMPIEPEMSVDGVIKAAMDVDRCLLRFYREVSENADPESVREVFRNLIEMEEAELRKLALNALGATDI